MTAPSDIPPDLMPTGEPDLTWDPTAAEAAHGHYRVPDFAVPEAVREIDRLCRALADCVTGVSP